MGLSIELIVVVGRQTLPYRITEGLPVIRPQSAAGAEGSPKVPALDFEGMSRGFTSTGNPLHWHVTD
jgi:hypothetical protein